MNHEITTVDPETGEVTTRNANFVQFYKDNLSVLDQIILERPAAMRIVFWLIRLMDDQNAIVASQPAMAEALDMHRNTVGLAIKYLKSMKVIDMVRTGSSWVYAINNQIVWQDSAANKKFALFSSKVYVVKSEQEVEYVSIKRPIATKKKGKPKDTTSTRAMRSSKSALAD